MRFDPKTALENCDTLMLDMDGTILDLAYDNYMWLTRIPECWGSANDMTLEDARRQLFSRYAQVRGELEWYCLDHWSERLNLDVMQLHREHHDRIAWLPGARDFLHAVSLRDIRVLLVTNSHPDTLALKRRVTGFDAFFDGIYSAHDIGHAKESQAFWQALQGKEGFDPATTVFVDDTEFVLDSAAEYGIASLFAITLPDTTAPMRQDAAFAGISGVAELL